MFQLDSRLANDTTVIGSFALCEVLLMNDASYPWIILVPRQSAISEIFQLSETDQRLLMQESVFVSRKMRTHFQADKMNVAALGNVVSQLHVHHIARYKKDLAWPAPVWGVKPAAPYTKEEMEITVNTLKALFAEKLECANVKNGE